MPKSLNIKNQNKEKSTWKAMDRAALFSSAPSVSWGPSPPNNTNNNDKKENVSVFALLKPTSPQRTYRMTG